jgi:hypothetical protein
MVVHQLDDHFTSLRVFDRLGLQTLGKVVARLSDKQSR